MPYKIRPQKQNETASIQIMSKSEKMLEAMAQNPQRVWGGIAIILLIGAIIFTMQYMNRHEEESAWAIEGEASKLLNEPAPLPKPITEEEEDAAIVEVLSETERFEKAAKLYEEVLTKHASSDAAVVSLFESGIVYEKLEMNDKAETQFLAFIQKHPNHRLTGLSHLKLAYLYQKKGDNAAAIDRLRTVYEIPENDSRDQAGFEWARVLESDGKTDEAKALYEKLSEEFSETPWGTEAKARFILLAPPTEPAADAETPKEEKPMATEEKPKPLPEEIPDE